VITPDGAEVNIALRGELAGILEFSRACSAARGAGGAVAAYQHYDLVAGAGFEPATFRL
jgi:hypothetical protein